MSPASPTSPASPASPVPPASSARVRFHPLTFVEERDGITVGRADIESYALLPEDGVALLRRLADGATADEAAAWYARTFGEPVDVADFLDTLRELGFVREAGEAAAEPPKVRLQRLGRIAFSPVLWLLYAALVAAAGAEMVRHAELRPHAHNVFFTSSLIAVQVGVALFQSPAVLWHEWFHLLAARRLGLASRMSLGRRFYYVVVETQLDGLRGVPPRRRYLPMLSGMLADLLLFSALVLVAAAGLPGGLALPGRLALAVAYTVLLRLAWQFYVFLRTDLYYVITNALGCTDPHAATRAYLRERFRRLPWVGPSDWRTGDWAPRDRAVAPWFALVTVGGVTAMLVTVSLWTAPLIWQFARHVGSGLTGGGTGDAHFWDSVGSLLLLSLEIVVLPLYAGRKRKRAAAGTAPLTTTTASPVEESQ